MALKIEIDFCGTEYADVTEEDIIHAIQDGVPDLDTILEGVGNRQASEEDMTPYGGAIIAHQVMQLESNPYEVRQMLIQLLRLRNGFLNDLVQEMYGVFVEKCDE